MNVEIITIGDELLIGQVLDTNSAWMGEHLNNFGFNVSCKTAISDNKNDIRETLENALKRCNVVLVTGGLGPTRDDITKHTLAEFFNSELIFNEVVFEDIKKFLKNRVNNFENLNREQAMVPDNCTVIRNTVGTAPIMWFEKDGKVVVSMPGVPSEMKTAMINEVLPKLKNSFETKEIIHKTILTIGVPEALLASRLTNFEDKLPENISLAYLPSVGKVRLRLSGKGGLNDNIKEIINSLTEEIEVLIRDNVWGYDNDLPELLIGDLLKEKGQTLACAESCTGGNIAHKVTEISGSSSYFMGGVVAYHNNIKEKVLGVAKSSLEEFGAVSRPVVEQMALGVRKLMNVDWAIATSGIAGPTGGTEEKPVGTVWIAWAGPEGVESREFRFGKDRDKNIIRSTDWALIGLLKKLRGDSF